MTNHEINLAIHEFRGWELDSSPATEKLSYRVWSKNGSGHHREDMIPDYTDEAEWDESFELQSAIKELTIKQRSKYIHFRILLEAFHGVKVASCRIRCEALLLAIGKWTGPTNYLISST